jgi:hypothetical protein
VSSVYLSIVQFALKLNRKHQFQSSQVRNSDRWLLKLEQKPKRNEVKFCRRKEISEGTSRDPTQAPSFPSTLTPSHFSIFDLSSTPTTDQISSAGHIANPKWFVFTARARVLPPPPSPTPAPPPRGSRPPPTRLSTTSASWPRRVPPLPRSVLFSVTPTVLPRSRLSLVWKSEETRSQELEDRNFLTFLCR